MEYIHGEPFVIDVRPLCVWDVDIKGINLRFIKAFDPSYFQYIAESSALQLEGESTKHTALTLRKTYSHALETFFALLGAILQAPTCVAGWMLEYRNSELDSLVKKINMGTGFPARFAFDNTWRGIARLIFNGLQHTENFDDIVNGFGDAWKFFAVEFLNVKKRGEYNSLKHGFRVSHGGFTFYLCQHNEKIVPDNANLEDVDKAKESMQKLEGSSFGSGYFSTKRLVEDNKINLCLESHNFNWNNDFHIQALRVLSASMANVKTFVLRENGIPENELSYQLVGSFDFLYDTLRTHPAMVTDMSFGINFIAVNGTRLLKDEEIQNSYINFSEHTDAT